MSRMKPNRSKSNRMLFRFGYRGQSTGCGCELGLDQHLQGRPDLEDDDEGEAACEGLRGRSLEVGRLSAAARTRVGSLRIRLACGGTTATSRWSGGTSKIPKAQQQWSPQPLLLTKREGMMALEVAQHGRQFKDSDSKNSELVSAEPTCRSRPLAGAKVVLDPSLPLHTARSIASLSNLPPPCWSFPSYQKFSDSGRRRPICRTTMLERMLHFPRRIAAPPRASLAWTARTPGESSAGLGRASAAGLLPGPAANGSPPHRLVHRGDTAWCRTSSVSSREYFTVGHPPIEGLHDPDTYWDSPGILGGRWGGMLMGMALGLVATPRQGPAPGAFRNIM